jgi:hypothetical protein
MVVIGNMGGKLKSGRYLDFPGYAQKDCRTTANLFVTLLQLAGSNRESFGVADPALKDFDQHGPLEQLLT